jgi:hypothetical protein
VQASISAGVGVGGKGKGERDLEFYAGNSGLSAWFGSRSSVVRPLGGYVHGNAIQCHFPFFVLCVFVFFGVM